MRQLRGCEGDYEEVDTERVVGGYAGWSSCPWPKASYSQEGPMVTPRELNDCVVVAVANATSTTYDEVKSRCSQMGFFGLDFDGTRRLIGDFGKWKETTPRKSPTVAQWIKRHRRGNYVLILRVETLIVLTPFGISGVHTHPAVAVVDGQVMGTYEEDWPITNYFKRVS
jgi:hypothetical protein